MASSLEELLAEEGFKESKIKTGYKASFPSKAVSMPLYLFQEQNHLASNSNTRTKTERTRSDIARYKTRNDELRTSEAVRARKPRTSLLKNYNTPERLQKDSKEEIYRKRESSRYLPKIERSIANSAEDFPGIEIVSDRRHSDVHESERMMGRNSREGKEKYKERSRWDFSNKPIGRTSFTDNSRKSLQEHGIYYGLSNRSSQNSRYFEDIRSNQHGGDDPFEPALDEVAIRAIISILCGYIGGFIKNNDFRTSLNRNCSSCLSSIKLEKGDNVESKVMANLERAMETVERVAEEDPGDAKDLKKASLLLSVITGLNSKDLKDGFTSETSNSILSACAHIYLSVVYKIQKKDKLSAKHLLQVFCSSPFHARTSLLPELWDSFFLPNLSHLRMWYNQEENIADTPRRPRKLKLLEKVYNEVLDSGTYQFAVYYKDWLTEGVEAPKIPSIQIPSILVQEISQDGSHGSSSAPGNPVSPQLMVSKTLYDTVFSHSNEFGGVNGVEDEVEAKSVYNSTRSSDGSSEEDKQPVTYSTEKVKYTGKHIEEDPTKNKQAEANELLLTAEEAWRLHTMSSPKVGYMKDELDDNPILHITAGNLNKLQALPSTKANELTLKKLATSIFTRQFTDSVELTDSTLIAKSKYMPMPDYITNQSSMRSCVPEFHGNYGDFDEGSFLSRIPKEFVCPITGQLFEDPVTLETGRTFERTVIKEWIEQGKRTCPVTGKILESLAIPTTNFVLKRIIDGWKSEHCRNLLAFASHIAGNSVEHGSKAMDETAVIILEQLLTVLNKEETIINTKHLISLGGLEFLLRRFQTGKLEEKTRIAALLSCCIEIDGTCRNFLVRNIKKQNLLELLYSKQVKSRTNAVLLLIELICLNRRKKVASFLTDLQSEGIMNTMQVLLVYLQNSLPEQRPLIAVLLLHFDILVEPRKYSIYREEAVEKITKALDCCLTDEKVQEVCCRVLLILGGHFSFSGKAWTINWLLKQAGFDGSCDANSTDNDEEGLEFDENISLEEEKARKEWLKSLTASLLGNGKKSFLESISKCLGSGNSNLVRVCLTTVTWMSHALAFLSDAEFQFSAFSILIPQLKKILDNGEQVEHRILASMSLLNFSKISECRVLMVKSADEIMLPLRSLVAVTWTAKQLQIIISGEHM